MSASQLLFVLLGAVGNLVGCGGDSEGITIPSYNPGGSSTQALVLYDENKNGSLERAELIKSPGLMMAMPRTDADGNGKLTAEEIKARIATYQAQNVGLTSLHCLVTFNGQPLPNAKVTFVPEEFLKEAIEPATGTTDASGRAALKKEGIDFPGIQVGLYRVQVSLVNEAGVETIPAQYNVETTLGADVAPDVPNLERGLRLDLKS